jgi:hypothetical protein
VRVLRCTQCGLSYGSAANPQHLLSSAGASCPRCGERLVEARERARRFHPRPATERHRLAVERSLRWAEDAAEQGDYANALSWLATIEAIDGELPAGYEARRTSWAERVATR